MPFLTLITLTSPGISTGPFELSSDTDSYSTVFTTVSRQQLIDGYTSNQVPDGTTTIRVKSIGACANEIDLIISNLPCSDCIPGTEKTIGTQIWTVCNLDVTTYRDGTVIPQVTDPTEWANLTTGAWCYYNNDSANGSTYGKLYNWYAVVGIHDTNSNTPNKILAPAGWHIPTDTEWTTLTDHLGGEEIAGGKMKEVGVCHWNTPNTDATNSSGFTGLPGGYRYLSGTFNFTGAFDGIGSLGYWWSSSEDDTTDGWIRYLYYNNGAITSSNMDKKNGLSVRLIKDNTPPEAGITYTVRFFVVREGSAPSAPNNLVDVLFSDTPNNTGPVGWSSPTGYSGVELTTSFVQHGGPILLPVNYSLHVGMMRNNEGNLTDISFGIGNTQYSYDYCGTNPTGAPGGGSYYYGLLTSNVDIYIRVPTNGQNYIQCFSY